MAEKQASNTQWPLMLQDALYTMRSARDPVTMTSPFKRLFGSDPGSQPAAWIGKPDYSPWSSPDSRVSPSVEPSPSGRVLRSSSRAPSAAHRSEPTLVNEVLPSSASSSPVASRCNLFPVFTTQPVVFAIAYLVVLYFERCSYSNRRFYISTPT